MIYSLKLGGSGRNTTLLDDITQSLYLIIFTSKTERIMMPDYAADALSYLDKPMWAMSKLQVSIAESVAKYEKRVRLESVDILAVEPAKGLIKIGLSCTINETGVREYIELSNQRETAL
ncbi:GPW/gp25 family protein [Vibrio campbellii]|uniref:GPW/gp25 family protein n=1 Tax=Vibrio campbellii TaxID=680 RepID=UPI001F1F7385|nr:GPW/gp25 family protein [Vibrio campbellii]MCE7729626.1 GPW/gp25 family protein [Vibrio campbellii]